MFQTCTKMHQNSKFFNFWPFQENILFEKDYFIKRIQRQLWKKIGGKKRQRGVLLYRAFGKFLIEKTWKLIKWFSFRTWNTSGKLSKLSICPMSVAPGPQVNLLMKSKASKKLLRKDSILRPLEYSWKKSRESSCHVRMTFYSHSFLNSIRKGWISANASWQVLDHGPKRSRSNSWRLRITENYRFLINRKYFHKKNLLYIKYWLQGNIWNFLKTFGCTMNESDLLHAKKTDLGR